MPALASTLRQSLDKTVVKARDLAERGAREALMGLAVGAKEPFSSMGEEERRLRNRLRARGRQLGDQLDAPKGTQSIERLVREMAYEHWHRMLFARFLAENQLLIEPSSGVSISLDECEELAAEESTDLWELAARFAQGMLPEIFRVDDPVLAVKLPLEIRQQLQALVAALEVEVFTASDSLGWVYQFWQTKRKDEVNDSGVKIGADELPAVTQLFTEDYMVDFLLDNTLGAWHAGKVLAANSQLATTARSEDELRQSVSLPGCPWSYLRFIKGEDGKWTPAAGTFEGWPKTAKELKCLDPCMGSGHFVVAMFERLVALRMAEEKLDAPAAVAAVIRDNLFGLELDSRCTQIGAFNLALAAWRRVGHCALPAMNLACSGLAPNTREADWLAIAGDNQKLQRGMERLYRLFQKAAVLGSLINPRAGEGDLLVAAFHELQPLLEKALAQEAKDDTAHEMAVTARGLAKAAEILAGQFTLVATNVPFLTQSKFSAELKEHIYSFLELAKENLASAFSLRMVGLTAKHGVMAFVSPQSWWFLKRYTDYRKWLLERQTIRALYRLGEKAFESPQAGGELVGLSIIQNIEPTRDAAMLIADASYGKEPSEKAEILLDVGGSTVKYADVLRSEDLAYRPQVTNGGKIGDIASVLQGLVTGDSAQYFGKFWERPRNGIEWEFLQSTSSRTTYYGGLTDVILWEKEQGRLAALAESVKGINHSAQNWRKGKPNWGKPGVVVSQMGNFPATLYLGNIYDHNCCAIVPNDDSDVVPLWSFCSSETFAKSVKALNQNRKIEVGTVLNTDFDLAHWQKVAAEKYPQGLPKPFSSDPTQWLFNGHPKGADQPLHVALARLLGYQWPRQTGSNFPDCPALATDGLEKLADDDGIVCLSPTRGELAAADRLRSLLAAAFGEEWSNAKERELLLETAVANDAKKAATDLGDWLRQNFYAEHCKLFHSRPFIWQIWDGNPNGFCALVNYHKLAAPNGQGRKTLELLTYTYLGDWIDRQKLDQAEGINGADDRLAAALDLQEQLKKILEGEPPYDLFVRWKPLHQQAIGWDPDINDGVRLNSRPFLNATLRKGGKTGAGILRSKPGTIKWAKDRGKEPMRPKGEFPWFWCWDESNHALATDFGAPIAGAPPVGTSFDGNRWNDLHYSRAAKEAARAQHRGEG
ncbi:MAG: restriction endonuclease subunit M [Cyanobium sp.]|nr:MAG: restriction endonuclease subunit M [Cyanobium sp.]